jgi:isopentenyl diphosphate isomerase/L-lactate dehydrogenase-like FMN-dependent dehydrogenase
MATPKEIYPDVKKALDAVKALRAKAQGRGIAGPVFKYIADAEKSLQNAINDIERYA